jgi:hypothetical protein
VSIVEWVLSIGEGGGLRRWWDMKTEAVGAEAVRDGTANLSHRPVKVEGRRRRAVWVPLVWAVGPTVLFSLLWFHINDLPEQVAGFVFFSVMLPAAVICEKLGFGHFNIFSGNTTPDWLFFSVMIAVVYLYSLVFVLVGRFVVRLVAGGLVKGER